MSMSWMLHSISLHEVVSIVSLDLKQRVERLFILLVVTASNEVKLTLWSVYALEVVRELMLVLHFHLLAALVQEVHLEDYTRIFLEQVNHGARWTRIFVGSFAAEHRLSHTHHLWCRVDIEILRGSWHNRFSSVFTHS